VFHSSLVLCSRFIDELSGNQLVSVKEMSRFTPTLADRIYMAVETLLDHYRRDGLSEEQIRAVLDRAIIASRQLEATRTLIQQPPR